MKYVFLLTTVVVVYFFIARKAPVAPVVQEITQREAAPLTTGAPGATPAAAAGADALKRPIDRTKEVLDQVKQRNGQGEF